MKISRNKKAKSILIIIGFLLIVRIILPYIILHFANKTLANMNSYYGHIEDIDLAIYRGAYKIKDIYIHKSDSASKNKTEFFDSRTIDLSIHCNALLHGKIVGELEFDHPTLRFTKDKTEPDQIQKDTNDFRQLLNDFMPLRINRFEILNGIIRYIDEGSTPPVNLKMTDTHILAENLTTIKDKTLLLPARIKATAMVYGGSLNFNMKLDPLAASPTFDMNLELKNTELPKLNSFFKAYGKFDVNSGNFGLFTEIASDNNKFVGYVKPLIKKLDIVGTEDHDDNLLQKFWEGFVGTGGVIFRNQKHDQVATKIPLEGSFKNSNANIWYAVMDILRNAFVEALRPAIDNEINIKSVKQAQKEKKGKFQKRFGSKTEKSQL